MRRAILPLLVLSLTLLAMLWFFVSFERRSVSETIEPGATAQRDVLLAARRMLERLGLAVQQLDALRPVPELGQGVALVLPAPRGVISPALLARLDAFARSGGHLLIESELLPLRDPLLDHFGIARVDFDEDDVGMSWTRSSWNWRDPTRSGGIDRATLLHPDPASAPLALEFEAPDALEFDGEPRWWHGASKPAVIQIDWDAGRVSAFNTLAPFQNWGIGRYDHAEFLHWLVRDGGAEQVMFVRTRPGGLLAWLAERAKLIALAGTALLLLTLWSILPRFGPILPDAEPARRRLLDHLTASGRLLWSRGERDTLARAAVAGALRRVRVEYPHSAVLSDEAFAVFLMRRFALTAHDASLLATRTSSTHPLQFLALMRACRRVHCALCKRSDSSADPLYEP